MSAAVMHSMYWCGLNVNSDPFASAKAFMNDWQTDIISVFVNLQIVGINSLLPCFIACFFQQLRDVFVPYYIILIIFLILFRSPFEFHHIGCQRYNIFSILMQVLLLIVSELLLFSGLGSKYCLFCEIHLRTTAKSKLIGLTFRVFMYSLRC